MSIKYVVKNVETGRYRTMTSKLWTARLESAHRWAVYRDASHRLQFDSDRIIPVRVTTVTGTREVTPLAMREDGCLWGVECVDDGPSRPRDPWRYANGFISKDPVPMKKEHALRIRDRSPTTHRIVPLRVTEGEPTVRVEEIGCEEVVNRLVEALAGLMEITHNIHGPDGSPDHDVERANEEARDALNFCETAGCACEPPDVSTCGRGPWKAVGSDVLEWGGDAACVAKAHREECARTIARALTFCDQLGGGA